MGMVLGLIPIVGALYLFYHMVVPYDGYDDWPWHSNELQNTQRRTCRLTQLTMRIQKPKIYFLLLQNANNLLK